MPQNSLSSSTPKPASVSSVMTPQEAAFRENDASDSVAMDSRLSSSAAAASQQKPVPVLVSGLMEKKASSFPFNWKTRFMVLTHDSELSYYKPSQVSSIQSLAAEKHVKKEREQPLKSFYIKDASFCYCVEGQQRYKKFPCFRLIIGAGWGIDEQKLVTSPSGGTPPTPGTPTAILPNIRNAQNFYFYCRDQREMARWKQAMIHAGAHFLASDPSQKSDIWYNHVKNWNENSVRQYLCQLKIPQMNRSSTLPKREEEIPLTTFDTIPPPGVRTPKRNKRVEALTLRKKPLSPATLSDQALTNAIPVSATPNNRKETTETEQFTTSHENATFAEYYGHLFREFEITGEVLFQRLTEEDLFTMGIMNTAHRNFFIRHLQLLKKEGVYKEPRGMDFIMKLEHHLNCFVDIEGYQLLLDSLTNAQLILNTYLSLRAEESIHQLIQNIECANSDSGAFNEVTSGALVGAAGEDSEVAGGSSSAASQKTAIPTFQPIRYNKISLVFLENFKSCTFKEFVHPVLLKQNTRPVDSPLTQGRSTSTSSTQQTNSGNSVGPIHVALLVGNLLLDWNQTSVIIPRRICKGMLGRIITTGAYELCDLHEDKPMHQVMSKIAKRVCHYNAHYHYHAERRNSLHFVRDLLNTIDVPLHGESIQSGALHRAIGELSIHGELKAPQFITPLTRTEDEFMSAFSSLKPDHLYLFSTFKDLDHFIHTLQQENPRFDSLYRHEGQYLAMLARVFWIRYLEDKNVFFDCTSLAGRNLLTQYTAE